MLKREIVIRIQLPAALKSRYVIAMASVALAIGIVAHAAPLNLHVFQNGEALSSATVNDNFNQLQNAIVNMPAAPPAGAITAYGGPVTTLPTGWLVCDGAAVSRSMYPGLFTAIGTSWGGGDGATTFNLPDLRGR